MESEAGCMADLEQVKRVAYKYIDGWAKYDDDDRRYGPREKGGDKLRRDLARFKALEELLLDHGDGRGDEDEPGQTVFKYYENSPEQELDVKAKADFDDAEGWAFSLKMRERKWTIIRLERAATILPEFRTRNLTPEEEERGTPEVKLVAVKRIPNVPEYVNTTRNPYGEFSEPPSNDLFHLTM
jgi:hypothetical protein